MWEYLCNLLPTLSFLLSFSPKLKGKNYVGPEGLFFTPFSFSLIFSPKPNNRKFHFKPYFPLLFHSPCFHPNQTRPKLNYFNSYEREDLNIGALIKMRKQYHKSIWLFWQISFCKKAIWQLIYKAIDNYCCRILTIKFW